MRAKADATHFRPVRRLLGACISGRACPAATVEVGRRSGVIWREPFGQLTYAPEAPRCVESTIFDLASLTKVIATASMAMRQADRGQLDLESRVADLSPGWRGRDREDVTVRQLLDHSAGLPAHVRLFESQVGAAAYEAAIGALPLDHPPGRAAVYSDVGFMLLGLILARTGGAALEDQFDEVAKAIALDAGSDALGFNPPEALRPRIAPTEVDAWRAKLVVGEVHDENAAALGGVAGHAGLFGTAAAVGAFARLVLETLQVDTALGTAARMRGFATKSPVAGSSRALAWDTMEPTSSCGHRMSPSAIGHTGFTGTSLWIDPDQDLYVVLLTNRVHPSREPNRFAPLRAPIHDAIVEALTVG